jgi:hypothetical protein
MNAHDKAKLDRLLKGVNDLKHWTREQKILYFKSLVKENTQRTTKAEIEGYIDCIDEVTEE